MATFNILHGRSLDDGRVNLGRLSTCISRLDPDVLALQEVDRNAGGPDIGIRREPGPGVDVGVPRRGAAEIGAVPDDGYAAGQPIASHDLGQCAVDGGLLGVGTRAGQCDEKENGTDDRDAHYADVSCHERAVATRP